jgi:hypothetical protein
LLAEKCSPHGFLTSLKFVMRHECALLTGSGHGYSPSMFDSDLVNLPAMFLDIRLE